MASRTAGAALRVTGWVGAVQSQEDLTGAANAAEAICRFAAASCVLADDMGMTLVSRLSMGERGGSFADGHGIPCTVSSYTGAFVPGTVRAFRKKPGAWHCEGWASLSQVPASLLSYHHRNNVVKRRIRRNSADDVKGTRAGYQPRHCRWIRVCVRLALLVTSAVFGGDFRSGFARDSGRVTGWASRAWIDLPECRPMLMRMIAITEAAGGR